jgi:transposase-like protein
MTQARDGEGKFTEGGAGYWKGKAGDPRLSGENNHNWKTEVSYSQLHKWARKQFGNPRSCWLCGRAGRIEMACINGVYTKEGSRWAALCCRCHRRLDGHPFARNDVEGRRRRVRELHAQGLSVREIVATVGTSERTVQRDLRALGDP